ncbi:arylsulfatase [Chitinophaga sp. Cy-1792]|uniref:arylsulfatase n=1 Tax=Chitinophaga sp. Cy-1792 TaxID=2608339 RepID=UPI0019661C40|nr:arylsulfatase [Chitinophaga sp. Cy-1792]
MNRKKSYVIALLFCALLMGQANAQTVLPRPDPPFKGVIGNTYKESKPDKIPIIKAPDGAPNVLLILIDDCGYGQWGTFGGQVPTPNLDRLAKSGLRYTRFHTTALCSPTRAALLTGRNHHSAGTGVITELGDAYPGYSGQIPKSCAMVSEILRQNGYSTFWVGKNHNVPDWETSISGPYDRWPTLQGFDHFYGFIGGECNQWQPAVYRDNSPVEMEVPKGKESSYTLNDNLADETIKYIYQQKSVTRDRPFFMYYSPGATHAPHHVPKEWMDKYKGKFSQGWDKYREEAYQRQLKLGVIPSDTKLTSRPKEIPAWSSLSADQKKIAERLMEAFAAYTAQTDYEIGKILDALQNIGQLENTLVICEIGDNGSSMEGSLNGLFNEMLGLNGLQEDPATVLKHLDEIGGPKSYNHIPVGWAWAMNTPFQWGKQIASHLGGTRNPLVISWPGHITDVGGVRSQFHHVIDIVPTILDVAHIQQPEEVNGVKQKPIEGVSMVYTFKDAGATSPRKTQYFEMFGNRALYNDGWIATCRHGRLPWENQGSYSFDKDVWELYDLDHDFSESNNLASQNPQKLKELQDMFWVEAKKYNVLPLDDRFIERADPTLRPSLIEGVTKFTYYPGTVRVAENSSPNIKNKSHTITASLNKTGDGVIVAAGGTVAGYALYVKGGKLIYDYNYFSNTHYIVTSTQILPPGPCIVKMEFNYEGGGVGKGGTVTLYLNNKKIGQGRVDKTVFGRFSADETFDVGEDLGSPVGDYSAPFTFRGSIGKVDIDLAPANLTKADLEKIDKAKRNVAIGIE